MSRDKRKKEVARVRLKRQMAERLRRGFLGLGSAPGGESEEGAGEAEGGAPDGAAAVRVPKAAKLRGIHKEAWDLAESQSVARTADGTGGLPAWLAAERAASEARAAAGSSGGGAGPGFLNLLLAWPTTPLALVTVQRASFLDSRAGLLALVPWTRATGLWPCVPASCIHRVPLSGPPLQGRALGATLVTPSREGWQKNRD
eukprot:SM000211S06622  [mRNA]  locus=s211:363:1955:+ [translate_table: standard]